MVFQCSPVVHGPASVGGWRWHQAELLRQSHGVTKALLACLLQSQPNDEYEVPSRAVIPCQPIAQAIVTLTKVWTGTVMVGGHSTPEGHGADGGTADPPPAPASSG